VIVMAAIGLAAAGGALLARRRDLVTGSCMPHTPDHYAPNPQGRNHRCNRTRKTANR
jgi:hypothetical protein